MDTVKICVAGITGRMGREIAISCGKKSHLQLSNATISENTTDVRSVGEIIGEPGFEMQPVTLSHLDPSSFNIMIDFTTIESTLVNLRFCQKHRKSMVIGTTGFSDEQRAKIAEVAKDIPIVFAPNTSRGIQLFIELLEKLTPLIGEEADIEILEAHHKHKKDAPSGTALKLGETIANSLNQELLDISSFTRHGICENGRDKKIGFSVVRAGDIAGEHSVMFALPGECLEIKHTAGSRQTFAEGAVAAADWLYGKKAGLYTMKEVLSA